MEHTISAVAGAVLYARVSTGEQAEHGTSMDSQREACLAKAAALGLPVIAQYEDPGISGGFLLSRPGIQAALSDIKAGKADTLICANLSRYSRDTEHQQSIKKAVRNAGGRLVFCDIHFDDTPEGDMMFTMMGGYAEYERKVIRERSIKGKRRRAKEGVQASRVMSPYGYHIPTKADVLKGLYPPEQLGKYMLVEEEAARMRWMLESYAAGTHSIQQLARTLNAQGIPTPRSGKFWRATSILNMLRNPVYKGEIISGRWEYYQDESRLQQQNFFTGRPLTSCDAKRPLPPEQWIILPAPALVSVEVWDRVQARLSENQRLRGGNPYRVRMLSSRVVCGLCGGNLSIKRHVSGIHYYQCTRDVEAVHSTAKHACHARQRNSEALEASVLTAILHGMEHPEAVAAALAAYAPKREDGQAARAELAALDRALVSLTAEEGAVVQAQIRGILAGASPDAYAESFAQIAARRKDMADRRGALQAALRRPVGTVSAPTPQSVTRQALADVSAVLTSPNVSGADKRDAIGILIEKVICYDEGPTVVFNPGVFHDDTLQSVSAWSEG